MNQDFNQEVEIDLLALAKLLLRKWWQIAIAVVLVTAATATYAYGMKDDEYTSKASMIVQVDSEAQSEYNDLVTGQKLIDTYKEVAKSDRVLNQVKTNLELDYSNTQLSNMISVTSTTNTLIINVTVTGFDKVETASIANEVVTVMQNLANELDSLEAIDTLDIAVTPDVPSGPNRVLYLVIGVLLGGVLGTGFVLAIEFLDRDIKTAKDVENKLGIRLLGMIPEYDLPEGDME
jgi:capsular polysaccharide biosynthesis protein